MACRDRFERRFQVGEGLHAVDLCGFEQGGDATLGVAAFIVTGEHCVLAIEGNRTNEVFDAPVGQEGLLAASMAMDISQLLAEA